MGALEGGGQSLTSGLGAHGRPLVAAGKNDRTMGSAGNQGTSAERGRAVGSTQAPGKQRAEKLVGSAFPNWSRQDLRKA